MPNDARDQGGDADPPAESGSAPTPAEGHWRSFAQGLGATSGFSIAAFVFGILFGSAASITGLPDDQTLLMSAVVFAGAAQFSALELWADPIPVVGIAVSTAMICSRHILMGLSLRPRLAGSTGWSVYFRLFLLTDANWALTLKAEDAPNRSAFFVGSGVAMFAGWIAGTTIGITLPGALDPVTVASLDYVGVIFLSILLILLAKGHRGTAAPWLASAVASVGLSQVMPSHYALLIAVALGAFVAIGAEHLSDA